MKSWCYYHFFNIFIHSDYKCPLHRKRNRNSQYLCEYFPLETFFKNLKMDIVHCTYSGPTIRVGDTTFKKTHFKHQGVNNSVLPLSCKVIDAKRAFLVFNWGGYWSTQPHGAGDTSSNRSLHHFVTVISPLSLSMSPAFRLWLFMKSVWRQLPTDQLKIALPDASLWLVEHFIGLWDVS